MDDLQEEDGGPAGSTAPADLGSTDTGFGLTAGGTGTQLPTGEPIGGTAARDLEDRGFDSSTDGMVDLDAGDLEEDEPIGPETGNTVYRTE